MTTVMPVVRRSARAVLIDDEGRLVVVKRTRPGRAPYWTTAGGGVEPGDASREAAVTRELGEELGVRARVGPQVFLVSVVGEAGVAVQHFFLSRLLGVDVSVRIGPEHTDPSRGTYEIDQIPLTELDGIDLRPAQLRDFIVSNALALLADLPTA